MHLNRRLFVTALAATSVGFPAFAKPKVFATNGIAIQGYDPVAYFDLNGPVEGNPAINSDWDGATWVFATPENKARFDAEPAAFAAQYGGYCAYAVSKGATAPTDPGAWTVVDNKLYLNFSPGVRKIWRRDIPGNIAKADKNWPGVLK